jgi:hypothetical protein
MLLFVWALLALLVHTSAHAQSAPAHVHVRGTSHLDARAARASGLLVVSGTLADDAAHPMAGERLTLTIATKANPSSRLALAPASPTRCSDLASASTPTLDSATSLVTKTDDSGRFCVRLKLPVDRYVAHVAFGGPGNVDATQTDVTVDLALRTVGLVFDPEPRAPFWIDGGTATVQAVAVIDEDGQTSAAPNLPLTLTNEAGTLLASGVTNLSGRLAIVLDAGQLGPAGKGELRLAFAGTADLGSNMHIAEIERHTHVDLAVPAATRGTLPPGAPEDGVTVVVVATARGPMGGAGSTGIPPGGSVEARIGDTPIGGAPLVNGVAKLAMKFATPPSPEVGLRLRYDPDAPWYVGGSELTVSLPVRAPSPLRQVPLVLAGVGVVVWLVLGRASAARGKRPRATEPRPRAAGGEARIDVLRAHASAGGWSGYVVDAHDGHAVPHATLAIERPAFQVTELLASTTADEEGRFELPAREVREGDTLVAEARYHASLRQPVPASGELSIALVLRKRALLDRLVAWAKGRGRPFDMAPEATPGHVRRAAGGEFTVAKWADAVERAAYGGASIDARAEGEVERLAPQGQAHGPGEPEERR